LFDAFLAETYNGDVTIQPFERLTQKNGVKIIDIKNKIALITGGAHRVGKAITMMLATQGANVVVNYNSSDVAAKETVSQAQTLGVEALAVQCDVADYQAVQQMADQVQDRFGGVDILINSASLFGKTSIPTDDIENDIATWHRVTRISIDGPFYVCNAFVPQMQQRGGGAIVNIVDLSVWRPWKNFTAHAVGKSALMALTRQLALELAPNIRVNAVAPGPVLPPPEYDEKQMAMISKRTLLKKWGSAEDVAKAVRYLVEADYVTGDVMRVDGGEYYGQR